MKYSSLGGCATARWETRCSTLLDLIHAGVQSDHDDPSCRAIGLD